MVNYLEDMKHLEKRRKEDNCTNSGWHFQQHHQKEQKQTMYAVNY